MNILSLKDIKYIVDGMDILKGISTDIDKGDCISIVGPSGSGKSTLIKILADLIPMTQGEVLYKNKHYREYDPIQLRREVSYCIQLPHLFGYTVEENLMFPFKIRKEQMNRQRVIELLERMNLNESYISKDIHALSGGEKQRVALIRNLIFTPQILLLDEVTSALDKENALNIETYIKELNEEGVTVLWITHNETQSTGIFNKSWVMEEGQLLRVEVIR